MQNTLAMACARAGYSHTPGYIEAAIGIENGVTITPIEDAFHPLFLFDDGAIVGPLDMGELNYLIDRNDLAGADHSAEVLELAQSTVLLHDPKDFLLSTLGSKGSQRRRVRTDS